MKRIIIPVIFLILLTNNFINAQSIVDTLKKHIYFLASDSLEGRYSGTNSMELATNYIVEQFKQAGLNHFGNSYIQEFPLPPLYGKNIIGYVEGSDSILKHEFIVLGAHYDHVGWTVKNDSVKVVYNGADDNASGTACIIEVGKELVKNKSLLKRSVLIILFDAEEKGLLGSNYFLKHPTVDKEKIKIMFSVDMVGWLDKGSPLELSGWGSDEDGLDFVKSIKHVEGLNVKYSTSKSLWKDLTDTRPFYDEQIPCIYVSTGLNSPYHKPEDDADFINYEGLEKIVREMYNVIVALSLKNSFKFCSTNEPIRTIKEPVKFGMSSSLLTSSLYYTKGPFTGKPLSGFSAGLFTQVDIMKHFSILPELNYCYQGFESPSGKVRLNSVNIPFNLMYVIDKDFLRISLYGGAYFDYRISGTIKTEEINWNNNDFNRLSYGYQFGWCFVVFNFQLRFTGQTSLVDFNKTVDKKFGKFINNSAFFTVGYYFLP